MQKSKILIDARMVGAKGHGIGNYVLHLAQGLAELGGPYEFHYLTSPKLPRDSILRHLPHTECAIPFLHPAEPFTLGSSVAAHKPDLFHTPSFASLRKYPCPHVQTIHDLNHLRFGSFLPRTYYKMLLLPSAKSARELVTVSHAAAHEIEAWLEKNGTHRKLTVALNAITEPKAPAGPAPLGLTDYFLVLSNPKPFKNLEFLKAAYLAEHERSPLPPLVINTPGHSGGGVQHVGYVSEADAAALRAHAHAFFFPSLYEGFGRPPLEAALAGVLPVVSDLPVHHEALKGVPEATFLSPTNPVSWQSAFRRFAKEKNHVSQKSRAWIREHYSISQLAKTMDGVYRRALGRQG